MTVIEVFFGEGRVAMTDMLRDSVGTDADITVISTADITVPSVTAYPMKSIWVTPDEVRTAKRVYG